MSEGFISRGFRDRRKPGDQKGSDEKKHVLIFGNPKGGTPLMIASQARRAENQESQKPPG